MYEIVHDNEPASGRGIFGVREPSVNQHGDVMVPVQKDERLLPQHNEQRVAKLGQLRKHKQPRPEATNAILLDVTGKKETTIRYITKTSDSLLYNTCYGLINGNSVSIILLKRNMLLF